MTSNALPAGIHDGGEKEGQAAENHGWLLFWIKAVVLMDMFAVSLG